MQTAYDQHPELDAAPNGAVYSVEEYDYRGEACWSVYVTGPDGAARRIVGGYDSHPFGPGDDGQQRAAEWAERDGRLTYAPGEPAFRRHPVEAGR